MKKLILLLAVFSVACSSADKAKMEEKANAESAAMGEEAKAEATEQAEEAMKMDVVDTAVKSGGFTTLVAAVNAADLAETLKGPGPFTVFAPTDEAFAALPEGTVEGLLKPEAKDKLRQILLHHVVSGNITSADATTMEANSMAGTKVAVEKGEDGSVKYAGALVTTADIECTNGVIHVINQVVLPPEGEATAMK